MKRVCSSSSIALIESGPSCSSEPLPPFSLLTPNFPPLRNKNISTQFCIEAVRSMTVAFKSIQDNIENRQLAKVIKRCQDLPGHELFQYIDDDGHRYTIASDDVNDYLQEITGQNFTAKDFRTWSGTVFAAKALEELGEFETQTQAKRNVIEAVDITAQRLGNTKAICRKCYIHPQILDSYLDGSLLNDLHQQEEKITKDEENLQPEEVKVLAFLKERFAEE